MSSTADVRRIRLGSDDTENGDAGEEAGSQAEADAAEHDLRRRRRHTVGQQEHVESEAGHEPDGSQHPPVAAARATFASLHQPVGDGSGGNSAEKSAGLDGASEGTAGEGRVSQIFDEKHLAPVADARLGDEDGEVAERDEPQERRMD